MPDSAIAEPGGGGLRSPTRLALLDQFLEQWIYGETKPTILPEDFS